MLIIREMPKVVNLTSPPKLKKTSESEVLNRTPGVLSHDRRPSCRTRNVGISMLVESRDARVLVYVGGCARVNVIPCKLHAKHEHTLGRPAAHRPSETTRADVRIKSRVVPLTFPCSVGSNMSDLARSAVVFVEFNSLHSLSSQLSHIATLYQYTF